MNFNFGNFSFTIENEKCLITSNGFCTFGARPFVAVHVAGDHKDSHFGVKAVIGSQDLKYLSHDITGDTLIITQKSPKVLVKTVFEKYNDTNAIRVYTTVQNVSNEDIVLEEVSSLILGLANKNENDGKDLYFTRFIQSHHVECQPRRASFYDLGLFKGRSEWQKKISFANIGSWSTKEELPQGIIECAKCGKQMMFQLESNSGWYYEISDQRQDYYAYFSGANLTYGGWAKKLSSGEQYTTVAVAITFGATATEVIGEMTKYRRHIANNSPADQGLPTIFNEYMHLSWDSPTAENTRVIAPLAKKAGVEYYVIDCGWHNEEPGDQIYPYVGQWIESKARFPKGVRETTDFIRSLGLKPGLWIEPEIVGIKCKEMLDYYGDDCFMQRFGRPIEVATRRFLDYRNPKVIDYMTETIRRMVEDYGAEYIKFDYNQDCGVGTDYLSFCASVGLEDCANAFLNWADEMVKRFPNVVFEACASGGMRMDYKTLSKFSLVSTSDQTNCFYYPYIAGNVLAGALPEQAAVWSYPVNKLDGPEFELSDETTILNMINSFIGRMHLASDLGKLSERQFELVKEGVDYFNSFSSDKKTALPVFPTGFTAFGDKFVTAGLKNGKKIRLAVWNLSGEDFTVNAPLEGNIKAVKVGYPVNWETDYKVDGNVLSVNFKKGQYARFFEIDLD
ncbi:MAG: alpha-galactosidase [Clostridia bacterium]|nr:alpha-galactosidase [Clostridia bacterium]